MESAQPPITLVAPRVEATAGDRRLHRAIRFLQNGGNPGIGTPAPDARFRETQSCLFDMLKRRREVANPGRIDQPAVRIQFKAREAVVVCRPSSSRVSSPVLTFYWCERGDERRLADARLAYQCAGCGPQQRLNLLEMQSRCCRAARNRIAGSLVYAAASDIGNALFGRSDLLTTM